MASSWSILNNKEHCRNVVKLVNEWLVLKGKSNSWRSLSDFSNEYLHFEQFGLSNCNSKFCTELANVEKDVKILKTSPKCGILSVYFHFIRLLISVSGPEFFKIDWSTVNYRITSATIHLSKLYEHLGLAEENDEIDFADYFFWFMSNSYKMCELDSKALKYRRFVQNITSLSLFDQLSETSVFPDDLGKVKYLSLLRYSAIILFYNISSFEVLFSEIIIQNSEFLEILCDFCELQEKLVILPVS